MSNTLLNHLYTYIYFSYQVSLFRKVQTWHHDDKKGSFKDFAEALYCEELNFHECLHFTSFSLQKLFLLNGNCNWVGSFFFFFLSH